MEVSAPATAELIESHQGLVKSLAAQIYRRFQERFDREDLIAYGQVGLAEAACEFDPSQGAQFSTYAYYRVRGAIYDGISKMNWTGTATRRLIHYQRLAGHVLESEAEVCQRADAECCDSQQDTGWFIDLTRRIATVYLASQAPALDQHSICDDETMSPSSNILKSEMLQLIRLKVAGLPDEERTLIEDVYFDGQTMSDTARKLGISKSWASRLHSRALQSLSRNLMQNSD